MNGKGDKPRKVNKEKFDKEFDRIFGNKLRKTQELLNDKEIPTENRMIWDSKEGVKKV